MKAIIPKAGLAAALLGCLTACTNNLTLPQEWAQEWDNPSAIYRPLQIVHGADLRGRASYYKDTCGLGGVVCNVPFGSEYLKSEKDWEVFVAGTKEAMANGLRIWIYDEDGYPSLGAGGRVLEEDPSLMSMEMVYDEKSANPFEVRPCYEYTHSCNNYYVARKYPNPLDPRATEKFIELTHQAYRNHLGDETIKQVEAFFTDEPSMMAVNLGQIPESARRSVRTIDPLDPKKKNLPMVSWVDNLPQLYKEKYGEELTTNLASIFTGDKEADKVVRQKFWSLLGDLDKSYYYDAIQDWCHQFIKENGGEGPLSSGHGLREESVFNHVPLDGNKLQMMLAYDIPGLDQLDSDPAIWKGESWMSTGFPASAAAINGTRRVMCEISDHCQNMDGRGPVPASQMKVASAWQMAFGVTDFTLYYSPNCGEKYPYRQEGAYREYCQFIGRVNSLIMEAQPVSSTLLYYPIYDLQREFIPVAGEVTFNSQNELCQTLWRSFKLLGVGLLQGQNPFVLTDYILLSKATVNEDGSLKMGAHSYKSLLIPKGVILPDEVKTVLASAQEKGFLVIDGATMPDEPTAEQIIEKLNTTPLLQPSGIRVAYGMFERDGKRIHLLVNTGEEPYEGTFAGVGNGNYLEMNPTTGEILTLQPTSAGKASLKLAPWETKLIVTKI